VLSLSTATLLYTQDRRCFYRLRARLEHRLRMHIQWSLYGVVGVPMSQVVSRSLKVLTKLNSTTAMRSQKLLEHLERRLISNTNVCYVERYCRTFIGVDRSCEARSYYRVQRHCGGNCGGSIKHIRCSLCGNFVEFPMSRAA
jgi:hypothetical protein